MKREELTSLVNDDLEHIPRSENWDAQAELRLFYNALRRQDLKLGRSKGETIMRCVEYIMKENPSWIPIYDRSYFKI